MFRASRLTQEGRFAVVTNVECGMRWTALLANDERGQGRTAKSCGPDVSTLTSSWRQCLCIALTTVTKRPDHRGEREGNRKTIAQGMPVAGFTCSDFARVLFSLHARLWVLVGTRHSLRPLIFEGHRFRSARARSRRGEENSCLRYRGKVQRASSSPVLGINRRIRLRNIAGTRVHMYANEMGLEPDFQILARDGTAMIVLRRNTREAAQKKAEELRDMGWFEVEIVETPKSKAA
jgi:hypothetical protein